MEGLVRELRHDIGALKLKSAQVRRQNHKLELRNATLARKLVRGRLAHEPQSGHRRQDPAHRQQRDGASAAAAVSAITTVPDETLHEICSLLSVQDLGRLARVSRRFSASSQVGARVAAMRHAPDRVRVCALEEGPNWLRILWRLDHLPTFVSSGSQVQVREHGAVATWPELAQGTIGNPNISGWQAAVCGAPMTRGRHYAEFTVESEGHGIVLLGIVSSEFNAEDDGDETRGADGSQQNFDGGRNQAWMLSISSGALNHGAQTFGWPGQDRWSSVQAGEVVGLELDIDRGTLAVWRRATMLLPLGVLGQQLEGRRVPLGLVTWRDRLEHVTELKPPLRWAANIGYCSRVRIRGGLPLQSTVEVAEQQLRQAREWDTETNG